MSGGPARRLTMAALALTAVQRAALRAWSAARRRTPHPGVAPRVAQALAERGLLVRVDDRARPPSVMVYGITPLGDAVVRELDVIDALEPEA